MIGRFLKGLPIAAVALALAANAAWAARLVDFANRTANWTGQLDRDEAMAARRTVPAILVHRSEKAVKVFYPAREGLLSRARGPAKPLLCTVFAGHPPDRWSARCRLAHCNPARN